MRRMLIGLTLLVWCACPAYAAIAFVQAPTAVITASGTSHQISFTGVTAASLLVCHAGYSAENTTATIADDKSNTWNVALGPINHSGATTVRAYMWYAMNVASGNTTVTVTTSDALAISLHCEEYSGAHLTAALDTGGSAKGSAEITATTTPSLGLTATGTGVVVGHFRVVSAKSFTQGGTYSLRDTSTRGDTEDKAVSAGAVTVDGTYNANEDGLVLGAVFIEAAAAGGGWPQGSQQLLLRGGGQ